jgi:hypothetical protein
VRAIGSALAELRADLEAAGFDRVSVDPEKLVTDPGCIWLQPRQVRDVTLGGGGTLVVWCYLIVGNHETEHAIELLDDALAGVFAAGVALSDTDEAIDLAAAVILPGNPTTPLPAYRVAVDLDL